MIPGGDSLNPSLSFAGNLKASGLAASEVFLVTYAAKSPTEDPFISMALSLPGASIGGPAVVNATDALCGGGTSCRWCRRRRSCSTCNGGVGLNLGPSPDIGNRSLTQPFNLDFGGSFATVGITKQLSLAGDFGGTANVPIVDNSLTATAPGPAPAEQILVGIGLTVLIAAYETFRKRQKQRRKRQIYNRVLESGVPQARNRHSAKVIAFPSNPM